MARRNLAALIRAGLAAVLVVPVMVVSPASAGSESSEVTFRLTLQGQVNPDYGFLIDVRCDGGDFCNGVDAERFVYICAPPVVVDTVLCKADSFEFTVGIPRSSSNITCIGSPTSTRQRSNEPKSCPARCRSTRGPK